MNMVDDVWQDGNGVYSLSVPIFVERIKVWNKNMFGNLFHRKHFVLARLEGAQRAIAIKPNNFLLSMEKQLMEEYNSIMDQKQEFWALK